MSKPPAEIRRQLTRLRVVAITDAVLLVFLVTAALRDAEGVIDVLGPLHGAGFLLQLYLVARGAGERWWGWWFPAAVLLTAGPPGALFGDMRVRRQLAAHDG